MTKMTEEEYQKVLEDRQAEKKRPQGNGSLTDELISFFQSVCKAWFLA